MGKIPGQDVFKGEAYHSARYKKGLDFTGKNVVVMGTGATAMGLCPEIKKTCKHLTIFQGTPQWYVNIQKRSSGASGTCHFMSVGTASDIYATLLIFIQTFSQLAPMQTKLSKNHLRSTLRMRSTMI